MSESKRWRWVAEPIEGDPDNVRNLLVEGEGPLPGPRVVLACGNIDAEDRDRIEAVPRLYAILKLFSALDENEHATDEDWSKFRRYVANELAKARGEGVADA